MAEELQDDTPELASEPTLWKRFKTGVNSILFDSDATYAERQANEAARNDARAAINETGQAAQGAVSDLADKARAAYDRNLDRIEARAERFGTRLENIADKVANSAVGQWANRRIEGTAKNAQFVADEVQAFVEEEVELTSHKLKRAAANMSGVGSRNEATTSYDAYREQTNAHKAGVDEKVNDTNAAIEEIRNTRKIRMKDNGDRLKETAASTLDQGADALDTLYDKRDALTAKAGNWLTRQKDALVQKASNVSTAVKSSVAQGVASVKFMGNEAVAGWTEKTNIIANQLEKKLASSSADVQVINNETQDLRDTRADRKDTRTERYDAAMEAAKIAAASTILDTSIQPNEQSTQGYEAMIDDAVQGAATSQEYDTNKNLTAEELIALKGQTKEATRGLTNDASRTNYDNMFNEATAEKEAQSHEAIMVPLVPKVPQLASKEQISM